jgi:metal-dependent hydrolase (beta-lactamase superfamily II)
VLSLAIANHKIHRILIDTGSSADVLYKSAFELMKISLENKYSHLGLLNSRSW